MRNPVQLKRRTSSPRAHRHELRVRAHGLSKEGMGGREGRGRGRGRDGIGLRNCSNPIPSVVERLLDYGSELVVEWKPGAVRTSTLARKMLYLLPNARFLNHHEMLIDLPNTDPRLIAYELPEPDNKTGRVIYAPALRSAWFSGKQVWVFVIGNCPTKPGGMGANVSKLFLATKAAGMWFSYYSGVAVNFVVIDFSLA